MLPSRPDLGQLRRKAKELHRAATEGHGESVRRLRAVSDRMNLAAAQLVIARDHGFAGWPQLRSAVLEQRPHGVSPLMADKHENPALYGAADAMSWAQRKGWTAGPLPIGAVFTSQSFITSHLERHQERYRLSETLAPPNGRVFLTTGPSPVAVACLGVGAPALVTLLEQLVALDVRSFIAVGPAPAVSADVAPDDCVVIDRALRNDGVSDHYLQPSRYADGDRPLTASLRREADAEGLRPRLGATWTVPTPYRTTAEELAAYRADGVVVTELVTAALFAVALALGVRAASAVVVTRGPADRGAAAPPGPRPRPGRVPALLEAAIRALRAEVTA